MATEAAAEQHVRRHYLHNYFGSQLLAERSYFRVLAEFLERGQKIAHLSRRLGKARARANNLRRINADLHRQIAELKRQLGR